MEITNPAVTDGVDLFINIVIALIAFGAAVSFIDFRKENQQKENE